MFDDIKSAICTRNFDRLKQLLAKGAVNDLALMGRGLLYAAEYGQHESVKILIDSGASPDIHNAEGATPLIFAAKCGYEKVIQVLLRANCQPSRAIYGVKSTALHWATSMGHTDCVETLVNESDVNIDAQTMHGLTPLMFAVRKGKIKMVNIILEAGCDPNITDAYGQMALHHAAVGGYYKCAEALVKSGVKIDAPDKKGYTPIILSAKENNYKMLEKLIQLGGNPNWKAEKANVTALHWAAYLGHVDSVEVLIQTNVDRNAVLTNAYLRGDDSFEEGASALLLASQGGHAQIINNLLSAGASLYTSDVKNMTCLHYAAKFDNPECVITLLDAGMNPNGQLEHFMQTPLFLAIQANSVESAKYLIKANCSLDLPVYQDSTLSGNLRLVTPFEFAVDVGCMEIVKMLAVAGCDVRILSQWIEADVLPLELQFERDILHWLLDIMYAPKCLKHLCRQSIRKCIQSKVLTHLQQLPMPTSILNYLAFNELDHL